MALTNLYRYATHQDLKRHGLIWPCVGNLAPVADCDSDEGVPARDKCGRMEYHVTRLAQEKHTRGKKLSRREQYIKEWASLWRTIILSSLGKTLYPYSQYIRTLNLRNLEQLLLHSKFEANIRKDFFQGDLAQFNVGMRFCAWDLLSAVAIINSIGEVITKQTPLLEELTGKVREITLSRWISRFQRLTHLELWDSAAIEGNGNLIRLHCPSLKRLVFWDWYSSNLLRFLPRLITPLSPRKQRNSDRNLAECLNELRPQSLESFTTVGKSRFGPHCLRALSCHGESLLEVKLKMLRPKTIPKVWLLNCCTNLVSLSLGVRGMVITDLEETHSDAFLRTIAWLKECKNLRTLAFTRFPSATALMATVFLENSIQLTSLIYVGPELLYDEKFVRSLANQTSLELLSLEEEGLTSEWNPKTLDILVESLSKLVNLMELDVIAVFDSLTDLHIARLTSSLSKLEVLSIDGDDISDDIWDAVASLRSLQILQFSANTYFTASGILDFIERLVPGNKGLVLDVMSSKSELSRKEQGLIQEKIAKKVGGVFEFVRSRGNTCMTL
ncbi:hypothetical protein MMC22_003354 [Lobaria immixta]|nr:hypothetical protein [Lobaria immixta]